MPNWIEGTMKLRGKRENIARFFREGLEDRKNKVTDNSGNDWLEFSFKNKPYIIGTKGAFIKDSFIYMVGDDGVVSVDIKQPWAFATVSELDGLQRWMDISNKYNVDIRLYGIERGMEFTQEIIIVRGKDPINNVKQYEDWDWECPFPNMGG